MSDTGSLLPEPVSPGLIAEDQAFEQALPPSPPLGHQDDDPGFVDQDDDLEFVAQDEDLDLVAQEELRLRFQWLTELLEKNVDMGWGTAYRDFVAVEILQIAVGELGILRKGNGRFSQGEFRASTGVFALSLSTFFGIVPLPFAPSTWGNMHTMYSRILQLRMRSEHTGHTEFTNREHQEAWEVVYEWMRYRDHELLIGPCWTTLKYSNKKLRELLKAMTDNNHCCKCPFPLIEFLACLILNLTNLDTVHWSRTDLRGIEVKDF